MNLLFPIKMAPLFFAICILSCESQVQKPDAFDRLKEEKMMSYDSHLVNRELVHEPKKAVLKKEQDEWERFKTETENKIRINELRIKEMKGKPNLNVKLLKQITGIENDNNDLRSQMDVYRTEASVRWENFQAKINQDVNEIGTDLNEIEKKYKK